MLLVAAVGLVGCAGDDGGDAAGLDGDAELEVTGSDGLRFEPSTLTADAGEVTVALTSGLAIRHTFGIEELGDEDEEVVAADAGATATGTVALDSGTYTFYCSVPGHRAAGMEGTLTVE